MTTAIAVPKVSSNDRISFTFLLALAMHALIILGVGFELIKSHSAPPSTIEVILTKTQNIEAPDDAQVIAEHNQIQSGSVDFDARPTSPSVTNQSFQGSQQDNAQATQKNSTRVPENPLTLHHNDPDSDKLARDTPTEEQLKVEQNELRKNQQNVAQLISELSREKQLYAKRPRINHIDTLSAKSSVEAKYIKDWVQKVEIVGNINYPDKAKRKKLSGTLILSVLVNHDGSVISSIMQQTSGQKLLDESAMKVVKLAAPFKQFPLEMREEYDQLMITRTWIYHSDSFSTQ